MLCGSVQQSHYAAPVPHCVSLKYPSRLVPHYIRSMSSMCRQMSGRKRLLVQMEVLRQTKKRGVIAKMVARSNGTAFELLGGGGGGGEQNVQRMFLRGRLNHPAITASPGQAARGYDLIRGLWIVKA